MLLDALVTLARENASCKERNEAAALLLKALSQSIGSLLRKQGITLGSVPDALVEDATQHVLIQASVGRARFRGESEGQAFYWCGRVAANWLRDELTRAEKPTRAGTTTNELPGAATAEDAQVHNALGSLFEKVRAEVCTTQPPLAVMQVACVIRYREGATLAEQVEEFGWHGEFAATERTPEARLAARDRVYKYRQRGRVAAYAALDELVRKRSIDPDEAEDLRRVLGGGRAGRQKTTTTPSEGR